MTDEMQSVVSDSDDDFPADGNHAMPGKNAVRLMLGTFCFVASLLLLIWNEGCSVEAMRLRHPLIPPEPFEVSGGISTREMLSDEVFYLSVNAAKLVRVVEMYQWQQGAEEGVGYGQVWSEIPIDSTAFAEPGGHVNPPMPYRSATYGALAARVGKVTLSEKLAMQLPGAQDYPLTEDSLSKINPELTGFTLYKGTYYRGENPDTPEIGDLRVRFKAVLPGDRVSISGQLQDGVLDVVPDKAAQQVTHTPAITWSLRLGGWLAMFVGLMLVFVSLRMHGGNLPVVGAMAARRMNVLAMVMATSLTLIIIAMIWFAHTPVMSMVLLMLACGVIALSMLARPKPQPPIPMSVRFVKVPRQVLDQETPDQTFPHTPAGI